MIDANPIDFSVFAEFDTSFQATILTVAFDRSIQCSLLNSTQWCAADGSGGLGYDEGIYRIDQFRSG